MNSTEHRTIDLNDKPNHTKKLGSRQFALYLKSQPKLSDLIYNIEKLLSGFDPFYYNSLLSLWAGRDLDTLSKLLDTEYKELVSSSSFLHKVNNAIKSRFKCLEKIRRDLGTAQKVLKVFTKVYFYRDSQEDQTYIEYIRNQGYANVDVRQTIDESIRLISQLFSDIAQCRSITSYIIETIHQWRESIEQWSDKCGRHARVDYYIRRQDYDESSDIDTQSTSQGQRFYDIIQADFDFFWKSKFSEYIWFEYPRDPLIIRNAVYLEQKQQKEVLEKYFVEHLCPKDEKAIERMIKILDMLTHTHQPRRLNDYEEEEKLIENYLGLERQRNAEIGSEEENDDLEKLQPQLEPQHTSKGKGGQLHKVNYSSRLKTSMGQAIIHSKEATHEFEWQNARHRMSQVSPYRAHLLNKSRGSQLTDGELRRSQPKAGQSKNEQSKGSHERGWVFGKQLYRPSTEKLRDLVRKHEVEMSELKHQKLKPFSVRRNAQKNSIAAVYLPENRNQLQNQKLSLLQPDLNEIRRKKIPYRKDFMDERRFQSQSERPLKAIRTSRLARSQTKFETEAILQDPKEDEIATPKNKNKPKIFIPAKTAKFFPHDYSINKINRPNDQSQVRLQRNINLDSEFGERKGKQISHKRIKINTVDQDSFGETGKEEISVEQDETPMSLKQFFEVFRADTGLRVPKNESTANSRHVNLGKNKQKTGMSTKKLVDFKRVQSLKHIPYHHNRINSMWKKVQMRDRNQQSKSKSQSQSQSQSQSKSKSKHLSRSNISAKSFQGSDKAQPFQASQGSFEGTEKKSNNPKQYISLQSRQIPNDMIEMYIRHLTKALPRTSQSFTQYHTLTYQKKLIQILSDDATHSVLFEIIGEESGSIGQAIVTEKLSTKSRLRYSIEFFNVRNFDLLLSSLSRICEQLLSATPCEEVICTFVEDKNDPVSTNFIGLIDEGLRKRSEKFAYISIMEKQIPSSTYRNCYERMYIFKKKSQNSIPEQLQRKHMMNNYRTLVIETKCLLLASNFKLKNDTHAINNVINSYRKQSIGCLFVMILQEIMTKFHMKQLKIASFNSRDSNDTASFMLNTPFIRSIFQTLLEYVKKFGKRSASPFRMKTPFKRLPDKLLWLQTSLASFKSMTDLKNYLVFREYDEIFTFEFLRESQFTLHHQYNLSEVNLSTTLEFVIGSSVDMILLNNHKHHVIEKITRQSDRGTEEGYNREKTSGYLVPTTDDKIKLLLMNGREYLACSDSLDLYSYLQLFMKQSTIVELSDVPQIALPKITQKKARTSKVQMYKGLDRLFPDQQFYSASMFKMTNLWEGFYPSAVISLPKPEALVFEYPLIMGFFDAEYECPIVSFLFQRNE